MRRTEEGQHCPPRGQAGIRVPRRGIRCSTHRKSMFREPSGPHPALPDPLPIPAFDNSSKSPTLLLPAMESIPRDPRQPIDRMTPSGHRPVRTALIPWVIAFVALLGINVVVPDHSRARRNEASDEIGLSQLADNAQPAGRTFNPLVFHAPGSPEWIGFLSPPWLFLCIEGRRELPTVESSRGTVHGRAPPVRPVS